MSHDNDPISVTAYLRDLVRVFVEGADRVYDNLSQSERIQRKKEVRAIDDCFQLLLGRSPTRDEIQRITPW